MFSLSQKVKIDLSCNLKTDNGYYIIVSDIIGEQNISQMSENSLCFANSYLELLNYFSSPIDLLNIKLIKAENTEFSSSAAEKYLWSFLSTYEGDEEITIYADEKILQIILIKFLGILFNTKKKEDIYTIYELITLNYSLFRSVSNRSNSRLRKWYKDFKTLSFNEFSELFRSVDFLDEINFKNENLCFEFQLGMYLAGNNNVKLGLGKKIKKEIEKFTFRQINVLQRDLLRTGAFLNRIFPELEEHEYNKQGIENGLYTSLPALTFLLKFDFYGKDFSSLSYYGKELYEIYEKYARKVNIIDFRVLSILKVALLEDEIDSYEFLKEDIALSRESSLFGAGESESYINNFLVSYIYEQYRLESSKLKVFVNDI